MNRERPLPVWSRKLRTPPRQAPSIDRIVLAAIEIADTEGLAAVSMRRVAGTLDSGTATLYRYLGGRDDLTDLMVNAVQGETTPPTLTGDWRTDLAAVARGVRNELLRHPWLGSARIGRPALGPNSLCHHDHALTAAGELTDDITLAANIVDTLHAYVFGTVTRDLGAIDAQQHSGLTKDQWRQAIGRYLHDVVLACGDYPQLARRITDATDTDADRRFEFGLTCVLDGVARHAGKGLARGYSR